jgi:5-methyltetrahydrofolate--homocysteine methyltransferase
MSSRSDLFRSLINQRVLVADGAMGTMLQAADPSMDDFQGHEGCNEILNVSRPDVVRSVHDAYFAVGVDCVETNTFGANWSNLGEYDISDRIGELAEAGARIAREAADAWTTDEQPRFVIGSVGPGTKLPSLGHAPYALLRDAYQQQVEGMVAGGVDAVLVETAQDLLQAKAAVVGARRALTAAGEDLPIMVQVTVETTGTMLLGSEIGAALTALEPLGIDAIGLNCATGPAEMSEHLRHLSKHARVPVTAMPNAGLPQLSRDGAYYPLTPAELAKAHTQFTPTTASHWWAAAAATTPEHMRQVSSASRSRDREASVRVPCRGGVAVPGGALPAGHVRISPSASAPTPTAQRPSRRPCSRSGGTDCLEIARAQARDGRPPCFDVCIDYVGSRTGSPSMRDGGQAGSPPASDLAARCWSPTEPPSSKAGLELLGGAGTDQLGELRGRATAGIPVRPPQGARTRARLRRRRAHHRRGGPGPHRGSGRCASPPTRLIEDLTTNHACESATSSSTALTFPMRPPGRRRPAATASETIEAIREVKRLYPEVHHHARSVQTSLRLTPRPRVVLNSVFLPRVRRGRPDWRSCTPRRSADVAHPGEAAQVASTSSTTAAATAETPRAPRPVRGGRPPARRATRGQELAACRSPSACSGGSSTASARASRPTSTRPAGPSALDIINDNLLRGHARCRRAVRRARCSCRSCCSRPR